MIATQWLISFVSFNKLLINHILSNSFKTFIFFKFYHYNVISREKVKETAQVSVIVFKTTFFEKTFLFGTEEMIFNGVSVIIGVSVK